MSDELAAAEGESIHQWSTDRWCVYSARLLAQLDRAHNLIVPLQAENHELRADLAHALPVVAAAGAVVERREAGPTFCAPDFADLLDALARAVRAAREPRTGEGM